MAIVINSASQITLTGGTSGAPLLMTHLTTLANWPAGTTQATVDTYITRTSNSYTFNIKSGKLIMCQGYLDMSDATIKHEGTNSYIVADSGGVITGGKYVSGKVFGRTTWMFDVGAQSNPHPTSVSAGFLRGSGQINMVGLRVINNSQQPGASGGHTGIVFWAGSTGSFNLQDLEILSEGNSPVYATFNTDNTTAGSSSVSIREARVGTIRHSSNNVTLSFSDGGGGWIGGDNGSTKNKLLIPTTQTTYVGLAPVFQNSGDIINITNKDFNSPSFVAKNAQIEKGRITLYPNNSDNRAEIQRTFNFKFTTLTGTQINSSKVRATSQRVVTTSGVAASAVTTQLFDSTFNFGSSQDVTVWLGTGYRAGTGDTTYCLPNIITDDTNISLLIRHLNYFEQTSSTNTELGSATFSNALVSDSFYTTNQSANTTISVNSSLKTITLSGANSLDNLYDYMKYWLTQNMSVANMLSPSGKVLDIADYKIIGLEFLTSGTKLDTIKSSASHQANAAFANIKIDGSVTQATATNLSNVTITGSLTYNDNTSKPVTFTNAVIGSVQNSGTGIITITKVGTTAITTYTDAEINYLDSTLSFDGITSLTFYPTQADRDANTSVGDTASASPYNFKFGSTVNGVLLSGTVYVRINASGVLFLGEVNLVLGDNALSLSDNALLQAIVQKLDLSASNLVIVNEGVKKSSLLVPHNTDLT